MFICFLLFHNPNDISPPPPSSHARFDGIDNVSSFIIVIFCLHVLKMVFLYGTQLLAIQGKAIDQQHLETGWWYGKWHNKSGGYTCR